MDTAIPTDLAGEVEAHAELRSYTDIENVKRFMTTFEPGEEVICAEKIHGSCSISSWIDGEFLVSSKGLAGQGLALLPGATPDGRIANAYWRVLEPMNAATICAEIAAERGAREVTLFGELVGVQDLNYGTPKGELAYRAFDLRVDGKYLPYDEFLPLMERFEIPTVPVIYRGPFDYEKITEISEGQSMIAEHVREGVVIRPVVERRDDELGRVILKSVGGGYLTRKGNTTEYE